MDERFRQPEDLHRTLMAARAHLLRLRGADVFWHGQLSSSALSTAVAAVALQQVDAAAHRAAIRRALAWLAAHANPDGGWGDTPDSPSNLSTTLLAWSALARADAADAAAAGAVRGAGEWICRAAGSLEPERLAAAVLEAYGQDRTFSAPILTLCAIAGRLGSDPWRFVPQLPFGCAVLPHPIFRFVRLSVVSYALPALIAIGLARHGKEPRATPVMERLRALFVPGALRVLARCQPPRGGFLEAAPLTGFVAMGLCAAGLREHPVALRCVKFLLETVRPDGSWPIDTDLATWVTTLAVNALGRAGPQDPPASRAALRRWLLSRQYRTEHPFTHAAPGGWGWTPRDGGVPDADDTAGALLALHALACHDAEGRAAAVAGVRWLLGLQNSDGGIPTFCRGWGRLPFDRSCPDITAHVLRAFDVWHGDCPAALQRRLDEAMHAAVQYLERVQQADGSWLPLWFGNQHTAGQVNPTYGTAQVVLALTRLAPGRLPPRDTLAMRAVQWLLAARNADGGWGGAAGAPSTIEETALAVAALAGVAGAEDAVRSGAAWLVQQTRGGTHFEAAPIGLYFSRLWYSEQLYPVIFTVQALAAWSDVASRRHKLSADQAAS
jgi:squalene-hopene/tetraprenyl-beta-curcumene cyclase